MNEVENLIRIMEIESPGITKDKPHIKDNLSNALLNNRIHFIRDKDDKREIGFFTWDEEVRDKKLCITICNMIILKQHKGEYNLCKIRKWFRELYPRAKFIWKSRKRQHNFEVTERIGGHYVS